MTVASEGSSQIFELALKGKLDEIDRRLADGRSDVNSVNRDGFAALHFAVQEGHVDLVTYLIARGAAISLASATGVTPLFMVPLAPRSVQIALVELLLAAGADVGHRNREGVTARRYLKTLGSQPLKDWIEAQIAVSRGAATPK